MSSSPAASEGYRPDVDGLRALAVLSVILFHIDKRLVPGGFVGVDVFFVISGYLITRNIVQDLERERFSILDFYRRRVKRIAPAMLAVVLSTLPVAYLVMLPEDFRQTAKSAVWSLASLANVYFWRYADTSYFAPDSREQPLLHLWSLGVEEQFYLAWPILLLFTYRTSRAKTFGVVISVIALTSFVFGEALFDTAPSFVYYMLPSRAGELLLGALVAIMVVNEGDRKVPWRLTPPLAWVGLLLLAGSFFLISEENVFPGLRALPPAVGTALLTLTGHRRDNWASRLLSVKPLVGVGLVSYSAYLWHWPLLAFYRYGYGDISATAGCVLLVVIMGLGYLSYVWIEQPMRNSKGRAFAAIVRLYVLPAGALGALAIVCIYPARFGIRPYFAEYLTRLGDLRAETRAAYEFDYVCQRQRLGAEDLRAPQCVLGTGSGERAPEALLWGDSNAAQYIGVIGSFARVMGFRFRNVEIGSCPPIDGDPSPFIDARRRSDCRESLAMVRALVDEVPVMIISASWSSYQARSRTFLPAFFEMVRVLADRGKLVILVGKVPTIEGYDRRCREKALRFPFLECGNPTDLISEDVARVNAELNRFADETENVEYFEVTRYLCPKGVCAALDAKGTPRYFDNGHLSMAASWRLGQEILMVDGAPWPFTLVAGWPNVKQGVR